MSILYFLKENLTCDLFILNPSQEILLIKRSDTAEACPGKWALPGGFVDTTAKRNEVWLEGTETPAQAALRELKEETNLSLPLDSKILEIGIFEGGGRDPRDSEERWTKSFAYFYQIPDNIYKEQKHNIRGLDDASEAKWFSLDKINVLDIAFDHRDIIYKAINLYLHTSTDRIHKPNL